MIIQFTLQDLFLFLVCVLGIIVGILIILVLWNIKNVVGTFEKLLKANHASIQKAIHAMPDILENAGHISSNVRDTTDKLRISIPVILQDVECVTHATKEGVVMASAVIENVSSGVLETVATFKKETSVFTTYFRIIAEVVQVIYRTFSSKK